jgi:hypothetical protein
MQSCATILGVFQKTLLKIIRHDKTNNKTGLFYFTAVAGQDIIADAGKDHGHISQNIEDYKPSIFFNFLVS